jgi:hypothetical protein
MMPIDPRIALGVQPVQIESPLNNFGKALSLQSLMGQQQLQRAQLDDYKRKLSEAATLRDMMRGKSGEELETALSGAGYGDRALALRKDRLAGDKSAADTQKAQVEAAAGKAKLFANRMAAVRDQASYEATLTELSADPMFAQMVSGAPKQWTPEVSQDAVRQAMIAHGKILETLPKLDTRDTGGALVDRVVDPITNQVTVAGQTAKTMTPGDVQQAKDSAAGRSVQMRGQDLTRQTALERLRWEKENPELLAVETGEGPMLVPKRGGAARPLTDASGKPLPPKLTDSQKKDINSVDQQREIIAGAIADVKANPTAFSLARGTATLSGTIPESIASRFDSDAERQSRAYVFNIVSKVINERAGAAQSKQELSRLRSFLPAETDNSDQVVSKLQAFDNYLRELRVGASKPAKASAQKDAAPSRADLEAEARRRGLIQ